MASWLPVSDWTGGCITHCAWLCIRESAEWRCGRHDAQWDDVQKLSQLNDVPPSTPRLADFRLPPIPRTSTPLPPRGVHTSKPLRGVDNGRRTARDGFQTAITAVCKAMSAMSALLRVDCLRTREPVCNESLLWYAMHPASAIRTSR